MREAPLFVQSYDLHAWLLDRMEDGTSYPSLRSAVLARSRELLEAVTLALRRFDAGERALRADEVAVMLRVHLRLANDKRILTDDQLLFAHRALEAIGRQIGGWRKRLDGVS